MARATPYAELNAVLAELVAGARSILGDNFCGAYLQGSFAVGDADQNSDVDFLVVTNRQVTEEHQRELQALHERLFALPTHWAQHLEGSYVPREQLRRLDTDRTPWFYFDNGAVMPQWDHHDNTAVVRWSLREHGVTLSGPDARTLVEPVSEADLRDEVAWTMDEWAAWLRNLDVWSRRNQGLVVLSYCRMLHTLECGRVTSKREAGAWALDALDREWRELIQHALDDRPDPWAKVQRPADPNAVARTLAFVDYAVRRSREIPSVAR
jgi:predicted nucleotidyltransferase